MLPETIDRYQIHSEIARGGMAIIYLAYDPQYNRYVALKVLPQEFLHYPQFRARFQREIEIMISIKHPGIVPIYGYGQFQGQLYLVMRYMAGGSLEEYLTQNGKLSIEETASLITKIAPIMEEAHAKGIVHRDLKPSNILFDEQGQPFIADFGIARLTEQSNIVALTGKQLIGSPAYLSPEQARIGTNVDARSDIYSLGVMVFEMLTGELPYQAETSMKLVLKHIMQPVPDILSVDPTLPPDTDRVIRTAMAKDPEERYANVGELAYDLRIAAGEEMASVSAPPPRPATSRPAGGQRDAGGRSQVAPDKAQAAKKDKVQAVESSAPKSRRGLPPIFNSFTHSLSRMFRGGPSFLRGPGVPYITVPSFLRPIMATFGLSHTIALPRNKIWWIFGVIVLVSIVLILCVGATMGCYFIIRMFAA